MSNTGTIRIPANLGSNGPNGIRILRIQNRDCKKLLFLQITEAKGGEVHVNMEDHKEEEFKRPKVHFTLYIGHFKHSAGRVRISNGGK